MKNVYTYMVMAAVVVVMGVSTPVMAKEAVSNNTNSTNVAVVKNNDNNNNLHIENEVDRVERNDVNERVENVKDRVEGAGLDREVIRKETVGVDRPELERRGQIGKFNADDNVRGSRADIMAGRGMAASVGGAQNEQGLGIWIGDEGRLNGTWDVTESRKGTITGGVTTGSIVLRNGRIVAAEFEPNGDRTKTQRKEGNKEAKKLVVKAGFNPSDYEKKPKKEETPLTPEQVEEKVFDDCMNGEGEASPEDCQRKAGEAREKAEKEEKCKEDPNAEGCQEEASEERCIDEVGDCEEGDVAAFMELCALSGGLNCDLGPDLNSLLGWAGGNCDGRNENCAEGNVVDEALERPECDGRREDCYEGEEEGGADLGAILCMDQDCGNAVGEGAATIGNAMVVMGQNNNNQSDDNSVDAVVDVEVEVEVETVEEETEDLPENVGGNA